MPRRSGARATVATSSRVLPPRMRLGRGDLGAAQRRRPAGRWLWQGSLRPIEEPDPWAGLVRGLAESGEGLHGCLDLLLGHAGQDALHLATAGGVDGFQERRPRR